MEVLVTKRHTNTDDTSVLVPQDTEIGVNVHIGNGVRFGRNVRIEDGVGVGDNAYIGPNVVLHTDWVVKPCGVARAIVGGVLIR